VHGSRRKARQPGGLGHGVVDLILGQPVVAGGDERRERGQRSTGGQGARRRSRQREQVGEPSQQIGLHATSPGAGKASAV